MRFVWGFLRFWYDFIVGEDWTIALGVVIAVGVTRLLVDTGHNVWYVLPLAIAAGLGFSVLRAAGVARRVS
jgi:hypothetical protein